jgi:hypothetical protein
VNIQTLLAIAAALGIVVGISWRVRGVHPSPLSVAGVLLPLAAFLALLAGLPVGELLSHLLALLVMGGWAGLVLLCSRWLRSRGQARAAARAAIVVGLALLAWFPPALVRAHADVASIMHQRGSSLPRAGSEQPLEAGWYQRASAELRWRALLPLHPPCVTGQREICARLDALGLSSHSWREGLGPALIAAGLAYGLTLRLAGGWRFRIGELMAAYGIVSAGMVLLESLSSISLGPLSWPFVLPGTPYWAGAVPLQLTLASLVVAAGLGIKQGRRRGSILALAYAASVILLAGILVVVSYNPGLMGWIYHTTLYGSGGPALLRVVVPATIVALHLTRGGRTLLGLGDEPRPG